ncbi:PAS domain S-box protein [Haloarchaeobius sp. TZWWS8]|uniref:PAS domain S-box protein n=1 Tax=Haloarchaeobius sp. TZWWS8 TaxID=3446121 RepID=UPI003EBA989C
MEVSEEQRRLLGVGSIVIVGIVLLVVQILDAYEWVLTGATVWAAALEFAFPGLLTIGLILAAVWVWFAGWPADRVTHIAKWGMGAVIATTILELWVLGTTAILRAGGTINFASDVTNTALIGLLAGSAIGLYSARQREDQRQLEESEERYRSLTEDVLDSSDVGIWILDDDFRVVWVNKATEEYFGIERQAVVGRDKRELIQKDIKHRFEDSDRFADLVLSTYEDNTYEEEFECHAVDGADRWLEHWSQPIESGLYRGGRIEHYTDITERKQSNQLLERREATLRAVHDVLLDRSTPLEDRIDSLLRLGREMLGVEHAVFSQVADGEAIVRAVDTKLEDVDLERGWAISTEGTYAQKVVQTGEPQYVEHFAEQWPDMTDLRSYQQFGLEYYAGIPVYVDGELEGVLGFADPAPRDETAEWELALLEIMANSLGHELEHRKYEREQEQQIQEQRQQFESLVEDVEDYAIFRLDPNGKVESWNRGAEAIKEYTADEIIGKHVSTFYTDEDREAGRADVLLNRAAEEGRAVDEGWRVRKDGSHFWANVAITALTGDDDELWGYLKVTRDMTERRAQQQQIEHERERLEFMNRIIRHNLLNGMNVVHARAGLLQGHVDEEMATHLDTVENRVEDMIDLIETMRAFMKAIVEGEEHEPEPVPLGEVLEDEIMKASNAYDDAVYECEGIPAIDVLADDLLPEVFENLLTNAVQHNDKPTAIVHIDTEIGDDEVVVSVSDNGPGIDEEVMDAVFEKGRKGFDSPGTGFGLYLVREIIESYGGNVRVYNSEDGGAVFTIVLPRA